MRRAKTKMCPTDARFTPLQFKAIKSQSEANEVAASALEFLGKVFGQHRLSVPSLKVRLMGHCSTVFGVFDAGTAEIRIYRGGENYNTLLHEAAHIVFDPKIHGEVFKAAHEVLLDRWERGDYMSPARMYQGST